MRTKMKDPHFTIGQNGTVIPSDTCRDSPLYRCSLDETVELRCPVVTPLSIHLEFTGGVLSDELFERTSPLPFAASDVFNAYLTSAKRLTDSDAVKETWELEFTVPYGEEPSAGVSLAYKPGDAFGFICLNPEREVSGVLELTEGGLERKDEVCTLHFAKSAKQFAHLPRGPTTLARVMRTCCDIRGVVKKGFLRALAEYAQNGQERRRLLELSSREGAADYGEHVLARRLNVLDILTVFSSCRPPPELLLEHLPRLLPRFYSAASWDFQRDRTAGTVFKIIYKRIVFPASPGSVNGREGLCTGWLTEMAIDWTRDDVEERLENLSLNVDRTLKMYVVPVYLRKNAGFWFPEAPNAKVVMVGPGAGVAPFLAYLQWREQTMSLGVEFGEAWLFFGCRYLDLDFLYKDQLERFLEKGVLTRLTVASSRGLSTDGDVALQNKYVQDCIRESWKDLSRMLVQEGAYVMVCGDARNMAVDVRSAFLHVLLCGGSVETADAAEHYLKAMQKEGRYLQDVWA